MIEFRHRTCTSVATVYVGPEPLVAGQVIKASHWLSPDGVIGLPLVCPDCHQSLGYGRTWLTEREKVAA